MPEHTLKALQELHLDQYLPYVLQDDQNSDDPDPDIPMLNPKKVTKMQREDAVNSVLQKLSVPHPVQRVKAKLNDQDRIEQQKMFDKMLNQDSENDNSNLNYDEDQEQQYQNQ